MDMSRGTKEAMPGLQMRKRSMEAAGTNRLQGGVNYEPLRLAGYLLDY